jgi:2-polyprenyl-3-methyl-5-hydroxy-6-metoxy-1,4-benzoquinol methylase
MAGSFNESYRGTPPWDVGHPQAEFVGLGRGGEIGGSVLDVGCGTGENALFFAGLGLEVWGLDAAPLAIEKASKKAAQRRAAVSFVVGDALDLQRLGRRFDTVTDCGLFHVFADEERVRFVKSLGSALKRGGTYFMLCMSDAEPAGWGGPRRVTRDEIMTTFTGSWEINWIREARFESTLDQGGHLAWLTSVTSV